MPPMQFDMPRNQKASPSFSAVEAFKRKSDWTFYQAVDQHPGESVYALAKAIGWSTGKAYSSVQRLAGDGLVRIETSWRGRRRVLVVIPREWQEFFSSDEMGELRKMRF
jgi:DNA-binding MarR family transcriptional regulator